MNSTPTKARKIASYTLAAALASTGVVALAPTTAMAVPAGGYADLVSTVSPAVVRVEVSTMITPASHDGQMSQDQFMQEFQRRFGGQIPGLPGMPGMPGGEAPQQQKGLGSGFIISQDGLIVTNNHVVDGATEVNVKFSDGSDHKATVVGTDPLTDIALIRVKTDKPLPMVKFGSSDALRVGDEVIAMGNPFGLGGTVTSGIVSAKARNINSGPFDDFIQTDAAINRGNSGGPLFNAAGDVVGVNTAIFSPDGGSVGIGFAVPSDMVKTVVADLKDDGKMERGWLGVQIKPMSPEIANVLGYDSSKGAVVEKVMDGSPAQKAGVQNGDIVLSFDGKAISDVRDLTRAVASTAPDTASKVEVLRKGQKMTLDVTLSTRSADKA
ncbi:Do family serine endopeptidase [Brevirhabdus sp.]|uniref:Do family serine endopeptidase n=1 Tax=Brevirhabdus sp. TaxID=2004514 RepID=UPI004058294E